MPLAFCGQCRCSFFTSPCSARLYIIGVIIQASMPKPASLFQNEKARRNGETQTRRRAIVSATIDSVVLRVGNGWRQEKKAKVARSASPPAASPPRPSHVTPSQDASREEPPLTHPPKTEKDVERVDHTAKPTERRISPQRRDSYSTVVGSCSTDQEKATENATNVFGSGPIQFCETHHL